MSATIGCKVERFFLDFTVGHGDSKQTLRLDFEASGGDAQQMLEDLAQQIYTECGGLVGAPSLTLTVERDERDEPCPECRDGEVESVGRSERETGHQPVACNASCGFWS